MCFDNYFQSLQAGGEGRTEQITLRLILEIILFYVTLQYNLLMHCFFPERLRWWDRIDNKLLLGALPRNTKDLHKLHKEEEVETIVNLCKICTRYTKFYSEFNIKEYSYPTYDFTHPSLSTIKKAVFAIDNNINEGKTVYVHCKAGKGRSMIIVLCYLLYSKKWTIERAQRHISGLRPQVNDVTNYEVVRQFYEKLTNGDLLTIEDEELSPSSSLISNV